MAAQIPTQIVSLVWTNDVCILAAGEVRYHKVAVSVPEFTGGDAYLETAPDGDGPWAPLHHWPTVDAENPVRVALLDRAFRHLRVRRTAGSDASGWVERYDQRDRNVSGGGA